MKTKQIILELVDYLEMYLNENPEDDKDLTLTDFIGFLNKQHQPEGITRNKLSGEKYDEIPKEITQNSIATDISILISLMGRYAKMYVKKALKDSPIRTVDEFSLLITLLTYATIPKHELIKSQVMEKTSGIEIINRLVKRGLIHQFDDHHDKRSKLLEITPAGRDELLRILPGMQLVSEIVTGTLTLQEQNQLTYLMRKLDYFHHAVYLNDKESDLSEIHSKLHSGNDLMIEE